EGPVGDGPRPGLRPPLPQVHDSTPPGRDHHGERAFERAGRGPGRPGVPVRRRRERRPDHRDRPHEPDARCPFREPSVKSEALFAIVALSVAACAPSQRPFSTAAPSPDPRVGLRAGWMDAGEAAWNIQLVSTTPPSPDFINRSNPGDFQFINSDLSFTGPYVIQGNYSGVQVWDITNLKSPRLHKAFVCPGSQSDVSVYRQLLFVSGEALNGRTDCGTQGVRDTVSHDRLRGIRIFDVTDIADPRHITDVQTCRGSHTHTLVTSPTDTANVYVYVSGSAPVRSPTELAGCSGAPPDSNPNSALFRIEVIQVPLAHPEQARIVNPPTRGNGPPPGPTQCHDITVYPAIGLAGGACGGYGLLLDIRDVANPKRIGAVADSNFSFWHSATFNNDGTKILFTDEWGGGLQPRCRVTDKPEWGADALFTRSGNTMTFQSYYKLPAPQTAYENCVAHNGTLIPIPGRDIMAQAWYQGRHLGVRLDRSGAPTGNRLFRPRPDGLDQAGRRRVVVRVLVQRLHRELRDF